MQALGSQLAYLLGARQQFKIKFKQYDGGAHIFYPCYSNVQHMVMYDDLIAWIWGNSLKIGLVKTVRGKRVSVTLIGRKPAKGVHIEIDRDNIL